MSPGPSMRQLSNEKKRKRRYKQPRDIREGVTNAYFMIKEVSSFSNMMKKNEIKD